ncbi:hypothetical protein [Okeania sp.]|nr:hypothetical protein [Okeania sp.]MEB3340799.1 hypothetical protein [Okeania sp.]
MTGHSHRITSGYPELYEKDGTLYLKVLSETASLTYWTVSPKIVH